MSSFLRARSAEQKEQRLAEIKQATAELFAAQPYQAITLTTIAQALDWSRANLYKYVTTKEEIFLELAGDAHTAYSAAVADAFEHEIEAADTLPLSASKRTHLANQWAKAAADHRDWFHYGSILFTVIETNVTAERLARFKRGYYDAANALAALMSQMLGITPARAGQLYQTVYYHAVGTSGYCAKNPLVAEALAIAGIEKAPLDFEEDLSEFVLMCIER